MNHRMTVSILVVFLFFGVSAATAAETVTTAFSYQGRLDHNGVPADGYYDFQFALFNAVSGGKQSGSTLSVNHIDVGNGLFSTALDFGDVYSDDTQLFLEIKVAEAGSGVYETLSPRQALMAAPFATRAASGAEADHATLADADGDQAVGAGDAAFVLRKAAE